MNINLKIKFYTDDYGWLCFNHAVKESLGGKEVKTEVDDFSTPWYMGSTYCEKCWEENNDESTKG